MKLSRESIYAIVGVSQDESKYGYKVYKDLLEAGYEVYPVNPKGGKLFGNTVYKNLRDIFEKIDIVITVVPPVITEKIVVEMSELGVKKLWMQPGSESERVIELCNKLNIECQSQACIMVKRKK